MPKAFLTVEMWTDGPSHNRKLINAEAKVLRGMGAADGDKIGAEAGEKAGAEAGEKVLADHTWCYHLVTRVVKVPF